MWWRCCSCICPRRTLSGPWCSSWKAGSTRCTVGGWRVGPSACKSVHGPHWLLNVQDSVTVWGGAPRKPGLAEASQTEPAPFFYHHPKALQLGHGHPGCGNLQNKGSCPCPVTQVDSDSSASHVCTQLSSTEPHPGNLWKAASPVGSPLLAPESWNGQEAPSLTCTHPSGLQGAARPGLHTVTHLHPPPKQILCPGHVHPHLPLVQPPLTLSAQKHPTQAWGSPAFLGGGSHMGVWLILLRFLQTKHPQTGAIPATPGAHCASRAPLPGETPGKLSISFLLLGALGSWDCFLSQGRP